MPQFQISSTYEPQGDQPAAIAELTEGLRRGDRFQTLLGATGTGKTFSIANVIAAYGRPTLVTSHNKTLAAQLYGELKALFPRNAVEYFISYYDYYQPEAYVPSTDTLHREGLQHQRGYRAPALAHDVVPHGEGRRDRSGVGVLHLRLGQPSGLPLADAPPTGGPADRSQGDSEGSGGNPVSAQRLRIPAGHVPGPGGYRGDLSGV